MRKKPSAPRVAALRERRAALGLVRLELYVRPEHVQRIREYAARIEREEKPAEPTPGG